jgi:hypothetical protein
MMNNNADASGNANSLGDVPDDRSAPPLAPRDVDESALPHIVHHPLPSSRRDTARQQRDLRRMTRQRRAPLWVKKVPWILFPVYGFMRMHDENYDEHYEHWEEQQRRDYDQR